MSWDNRGKLATVLFRMGFFCGLWIMVIESLGFLFVFVWGGGGGGCSVFVVWVWFFFCVLFFVVL